MTGEMERRSAPRHHDAFDAHLFIVWSRHTWNKTEARRVALKHQANSDSAVDF